MAVSWIDLAATGSAGTPVLVARSSTQGLNETGAPGDLTHGLPMAGLGWIQPILVAPNGNTFTSGGTQGWSIGDSVFFTSDAWSRFPRSDDSINDYAGQSIVRLPALQISSPAGRFSLQTNNIVLSSGGSLVTLILLGYPPSLVRPR